LGGRKEQTEGSNDLLDHRARRPDGRIGVAVASKFLAVGARNIFARTGVGVIASQAVFNPHYGPRGLALLAAGAAAEDAVSLLIAADEGRDMRQVHALDRKGRFAAHTGSACPPWSGHVLGKSVSVAGNMLAGPQVIEAVAAAYQGGAKLPFARRLLAAMRAGEQAGGDKRGRQSAALLVHDEEEYSLLDLRVDDHADPLTELERLEGVARQSYFRRVLANRKEPHGVLDKAAADRRIAGSIKDGYE
jgi:uncharacterized Ntn-hydrolase superfamily protein